ncbi:MAG: signal peptide peptidase SppA, partial [Deltaproteobacteria bacterium]|nr:signal peptide peptidase SppA [Deltaproteobacteria bacterium]
MIKGFFLWILKFITVLAALIVLGFLAERFVKKREEESMAKYGRVGLVRISGIIVDSIEPIRKIRQFLRDDSIESIVVRIDSPGGAVGPSQELYHFIKSINQKPVVASMGSVAASGGLYVALGGKKIFAQPGSITGSVGVIMQIPNVAELSQKLGVKFEVVKSGELKDVGNMFRPLNDFEREFLMESARKIHEQFIRDISTARNIPIEKVKEFADGRFLTGEEAFALGLIDGFADVLESAKVALELAGVTDKDPILVIPRDYSELIREILGTHLHDFLLKLLNFEA